jgi:2-methylisocitrate lyase-like PEP mutase family enzyme
MVEGGNTPLQSAADLQKLGYQLVIFPGALVRAYSFLAQNFLATLKTEGSTQSYRDKMLDLTGLNKLLGTEDILSNGKKYEG